VAFDTTPFVKLSIEEVVKTLVEAIILVFLVMYLFLQNFRATLIPTMAVPVVLLGTFGILNAFGYSINTLTMFAMVLAIGLLVDDDRGGGKRRARDERRGLVAAGSDAQVHDADHGRAGRYRHGAVGGVRADGLLRRFDGCDLPPVLDHDRVVDGAVRHRARCLRRRCAPLC
jgi:hypothetical protein